MPNRSSFIEDTKRSNVLVPLARTNDATSSVIDTQGFDEAGFVVHVGTGGITFDAGTRIDMIMQVSDSSTTGFVVADGKFIVSKTGSLDNVTTGVFATIDAPAKAQSVYEVAYTGARRFARVWLDYISTHGTATAIGVSSVLSKPNAAPAL